VPRTDIDIITNTIAFQDYSSCLVVFGKNRDSTHHSSNRPSIIIAIGAKTLTVV